jgi:hypothetical protein
MEDLSSEEYAKIFKQFRSGDAAELGLGVTFSSDIQNVFELSGEEREQAIKGGLSSPPTS